MQKCFTLFLWLLFCSSMAIGQRNVLEKTLEQTHVACIKSSNDDIVTISDEKLPSDGIPSNKSDLLLNRFDRNGNHLATPINFYSLNQLSEAKDICEEINLSSSTRYYITGNTQNNMFVMAVDINGGLLWYNEQVPSAEFPIIRGVSIVSLSGGGTVAVGNVVSVAGVSQITATRFDALGNIIWSKIYGDDIQANSAYSFFNPNYSNNNSNTVAIVGSRLNTVTSVSNAYLMTLDLSSGNVTMNASFPTLGNEESEANSLIQNGSLLEYMIVGRVKQNGINSVFALRVEDLGLGMVQVLNTDIISPPAGVIEWSADDITYGVTNNSFGISGGLLESQSPNTIIFSMQLGINGTDPFDINHYPDAKRIPNVRSNIVLNNGCSNQYFITSNTGVDIEALLVDEHMTLGICEEVAHTATTMVQANPNPISLNISENIGVLWTGRPVQTQHVSYKENFSKCVIAELDAKVFLENVDPNTGLMSDYLRTLASFPLSDPYVLPPYAWTHVNSIPQQSIDPAVLTVTGNDAIVDWIFVELRDANDPSIVQYTRSGLLQADGDIVDLDGISKLAFPLTSECDEYYIAIRHRNHLGFRTMYPTDLKVRHDFTNNYPLFGATPVRQIGITNIVSIMNGGDANADGSIDAFDTIDWEIQNGLFDDYMNTADYNMDGSVDAFDTIIWELNNGKFQEID